MKKKLTAAVFIAAILTIGLILSACNHVCSFGEWQTVTEPTCVSKGLKERYCECGKKEQEPILVDPTKHDLEPVDGEDADCTTDGTVAHNHCSLCGKNFDAQGNELDNVTVPKGHKLKTVPAQAASLHVSGTLAYDECSVCRKKFETGTDKEITDIVVPAAHTDYDAETLYCPTCDKYVITNAEQLAAFRDSVNDGNNYNGKTVVLDADIDLKNAEWIPINSFAGNFDGQNHVIKNLKISDGDSVGLFGNQWQCKAVLSNFTIDGASIQGGKNVGVVVGITASTSISNVKVCNATVTSTHYAGGIVGYAYGKIENCEVENLTITCIPDLQTGGGYDNGDKVGGIVGYLCAGTVQGCSATNVNLKGYRDIGGIVGALVASDKVETFAKNNVSSKIHITVDQVTNGYGGKDMNVDGVVGRKINDGSNLAIVENNQASEVSYEYIVDNASAQKALDSAKANSTIKLTAGEYDKLIFNCDAFNQEFLSDDVKYPGTPQTAGKIYDRVFENITIIGGEGVIVDGIDHGVTVDKSYSGTRVFLKNVTVKNITFKSGIMFNHRNSGARMLFDGFTVDGCKTVNDASYYSSTDVSSRLFYCWTNMYTQGTAQSKNLVIKNCTAYNRYQALYIRDVANVTIQDNTFDTIKHNAIALQSGSVGADYEIGCSGEIIIKDNTICHDADRAIRFGLIAHKDAQLDYANVVIEGNRMTECGDEEGQLCAAVSAGNNVTVTINGNYWNGLTDNAKMYVGSDRVIEDTAPLSE